MIVGVLGFIGSGKGTVGDILRGSGFLQESFARALKDSVAVKFNWPRNLLEGDTVGSREWREKVDKFWTNKLGWEVTPRKVLQLEGTEAGRNVFGVNLWTAGLESRMNKSKNYVITDVRFENEIIALKTLGGLLVRVKRGPEPDWLRTATLAKAKGCTKLTEIDATAPDIHISEWDWVTSTIDHTIINEGTLDELKSAVKQVIS